MDGSSVQTSTSILVRRQAIWQPWFSNYYSRQNLHILDSVSVSRALWIHSLVDIRYHRRWRELRRHFFCTSSSHWQTDHVGIRSRGERKDKVSRRGPHDWMTTTYCTLHVHLDGLKIKVYAFYLHCRNGHYPHPTMMMGCIPKLFSHQGYHSRRAVNLSHLSWRTQRQERWREGGGVWHDKWAWRADAANADPDITKYSKQMNVQLS